MDKPKQLPISAFEKECVLFVVDAKRGTIRKKFKDKDLAELYDKYPADCNENLKCQLDAYLKRKNEKTKEKD